MDGPTVQDYREWDERGLDGHWYAAGKRPPKEVLRRVRPLTTDYAIRLWQWVFQRKEEIDVLISVAHDKRRKRGWLKKIWTEPKHHHGVLGREPLKALLRQLFPRPDDETIFYLVYSDTGYETPWRVYLDNCYEFWRWYEEGLVFHPTFLDVAVFWYQFLSVGRRSNRRLEMSDGQTHEKVAAAKGLDGGAHSKTGRVLRQPDGCGGDRRN